MAQSSGFQPSLCDSLTYSLIKYETNAQRKTRTDTVVSVGAVLPVPAADVIVNAESWKMIEEVQVKGTEGTLRPTQLALRQDGVLQHLPLI